MSVWRFGLKYFKNMVILNKYLNNYMAKYNAFDSGISIYNKAKDYIHINK